MLQVDFVSTLEMCCFLTVRIMLKNKELLVKMYKLIEIPFSFSRPLPLFKMLLCSDKKAGP